MPPTPAHAFAVATDAIKRSTPVVVPVSVVVALALAIGVFIRDDAIKRIGSAETKAEEAAKAVETNKERIAAIHVQIAILNANDQNTTKKLEEITTILREMQVDLRRRP